VERLKAGNTEVSRLAKLVREFVFESDPEIEEQLCSAKIECSNLSPGRSTLSLEGMFELADRSLDFPAVAELVCQSAKVAVVDIQIGYPSGVGIGVPDSI
jgi:hypothetical protein